MGSVFGSGGGGGAATLSASAGLPLFGGRGGTSSQIAVPPPMQEAPLVSRRRNGDEARSGVAQNIYTSSRGLVDEAEDGGKTGGKALLGA